MAIKYKPIEECKQCITFARVSSREQEQGASIDAQLETIENYCDKKNLSVIKKFRLTESSTRGERKRFYEMIEFVKKQKKKTAIIVHCIDRLQRGYKECVEIETLLKADKIEVHFYKEGLILHKDSTSSDFMRYDMGVLSAKMYIGSMRDNVKRSLDYNRSNGKWQGLAPIGYINTRINNKAGLEMDIEKAPIIKRLFEEYATGLHSIISIWQIAKDANLCSNASKTKKPITRIKVHDILRNPFYYGCFHYKGKLIPHQYTPIIDKQTFDKVQEMLTQRNNAPTKCANEPIPFAFRGIVRCSTCGCAISSERHKKYTYLKCSHLKGPCKQNMVNEKVLLEQLNEEIFNKSLNISDKMLDLLKSNVRANLDNQTENIKVIKREITSKLNQLKAKEERLLDFYLEGKIDKIRFESEQAKIDIEKIELEKSSEKYVDVDNSLKETIAHIIDIVANASILMSKSNPKQKNELLNLIFESCELQDKKLVYKLKEPFHSLFNKQKTKGVLQLSPENLSEVANISNNVHLFKKHLEYQQSCNCF